MREVKELEAGGEGQDGEGVDWLCVREVEMGEGGEEVGGEEGGAVGGGEEGGGRVKEGRG